MEESQNFGHQHPLVLLNEEHISDQSGVADCSRCGEKVSAPSFTCMECDDYYVHKKCAEAPLEINHPFHPDHPLILRSNSAYNSGGYICDFCDERGKRFVYHCSCGLDFHIKCALFTYNIAEKNLKELEHVAHEYPLISTENDRKELQDLPMCFACWEPLANYTYFSLDCGFNLHKKCAELPLKITDVGHKHPLALQFDIQARYFCKICQRKTQGSGFVYRCSPCNFVVDVDCVLRQPIIKVGSHEHAFILLQRRAPFICDACGCEGNYAAYICCSCNIIVHKKCISLPTIVKSKYHDHHIFLKYVLHEEDFESWDCLICHNEVNIKYGSYCCSDCSVVFHVNCVIEDKTSYFIVSSKNEDENSRDESIDSIIVIERNDAREAIKVKHCKHSCDLILGEKTAEHDISCEGCMLPISTSFYYCSQCDFFLHKTCTEIPQKKYVWHHNCEQPLILVSNSIFHCVECHLPSTGFAYKCSKSGVKTCLRCVIALTPGAKTCLGHEHPLFYYKEDVGPCTACGDIVKGAFRCKKGCKFKLCHKCFSLPTRMQHKCDKDPLALTYGDANNYLESHYCDICEERRDPNHWFYHCATCDTSTHIGCALGKYPFMKLGILLENEKLHPDPLTLVKKIYYYPDCRRCGKPCEDVALECGCGFVVHFEGV